MKDPEHLKRLRRGCWSISFAELLTNPFLNFLTEKAMAQMQVKDTTQC